MTCSEQNGALSEQVVALTAEVEGGEQDRRAQGEESEKMKEALAAAKAETAQVRAEMGEKEKILAETTEEQTVYLEQADGTKTPYVIRETMPEVRGVLVVAQGAGDPQVVSEIKEAVMALFHLDAHKIKVMKKK